METPAPQPPAGPTPPPASPPEAPPVATAPVRVEIKGDVGAEPPVRHDGNLRICGSICTSGNVEATGSVNVGGTIEAATVKAGGDIEADGDIVGRNKGVCVSGGSVRFRSANSTSIEAVAEVVGLVEVANSRIIAGGSLRCMTGHIYGGHATVNGGVICATLGSPGANETLIEVGIDEWLRRLSIQHSTAIEANLKRVQRIRSQIEPLLANQKSLTAQQKESATELLYNASELEEATEKLIQQLRGQVAASFGAAKREVTIMGKLYPGVVIRFLNVEVHIERLIKGPIKVCAEGKGGATRVVLTDLDKQEQTDMKCIGRTDPALSALMRALAPRKVPGAAAA